MRQMRDVFERAGHLAPDTGPPPEPRTPDQPGRFRAVLVVDQYADSLAEANERTRAISRAVQRMGFRIVQQGETAIADGPFRPDAEQEEGSSA